MLLDASVPGRVRVVSNPRAGGGRAAATWARLAARVPEARAVERLAPSTPDALREVVPRLAESDLVVVVGGDGTLSAVLTALARVGAAGTPIALVPAGTMGTVLRGLGARADARALAAALAWARDPDPTCLVEAPTVAVHADADGAPRVGFLVALGLVSAFFARYDAAGGGAPVAAGLAARAVGSAVVGGAFARALFAPTRATVRVDGRALPLEALTLFVAGTLAHVGLGLRPLPRAREASPREGTFAVAASDAPARRLAAAAPSVLLARGLGGAVGRGAEGLARAVELELPMATPFVLDGDLHAARRLVVRAGPAARLLPAGRGPARG